MKTHPDYARSDLRTRLASVICDPGFTGHFWDSSQMKWQYQQVADRVLSAFDVREKEETK